MTEILSAMRNGFSRNSMIFSDTMLRYCGLLKWQLTAGT
jgi:hypothetical protein